MLNWLLNNNTSFFNIVRGFILPARQSPSKSKNAFECGEDHTQFSESAVSNSVWAEELRRHIVRRTLLANLNYKHRVAYTLKSVVLFGLVGSAILVHIDNVGCEDLSSQAYPKISNFMSPVISATMGWAVFAEGRLIYSESTSDGKVQISQLPVCHHR